MFDGIVGQLEHFRNMMEGYVDQTETAGYIVSQQYYSALIENEQDTLEKLNEERDQLIASLNDAVNSGATFTSLRPTPARPRKFHDLISCAKVHFGSIYCPHRWQ